MAVAPAGDFVVVWQSRGSDKGNPYLYSVQGRRYASNCDPLGGEFQVDTYTTTAQVSPSVAVAPAGDFVVVWARDGYTLWDVHGQRFQVADLFADGFESGDTAAWSAVVGGSP